MTASTKHTHCYGSESSGATRSRARRSASRCLESRSSALRAVRWRASAGQPAAWPRRAVARTRRLVGRRGTLAELPDGARRLGVERLQAAQPAQDFELVARMSHLTAFVYEITCEPGERRPALILGAIAVSEALPERVGLGNCLASVLAAVVLGLLLADPDFFDLKAKRQTGDGMSRLVPAGVGEVRRPGPQVARFSRTGSTSGLPDLLSVARASLRGSRTLPGLISVLSLDRPLPP